MSIGQFMPVFHNVSSETYDPYSDYVIMDLNMEDVTGDGYTLIDRSVYNNTIQRFYDAHLSTLNMRFGDSSAYFDGIGDHYFSFDKAIYRQQGDYTIELWVYAERLTNLNTIIATEYYTGGQSNFAAPRILFNNNKLEARIGTGAVATSTDDFPLNVWKHISYGRVSGHNYLYIDGVLQGTWENTRNWGETGFALGTTTQQRTNTSSNKLKGYIDCLRWWSGVSVRDGVNNFSPPTKPWQLP